MPTRVSINCWYHFICLNCRLVVNKTLVLCSEWHPFVCWQKNAIVFSFLWRVLYGSITVLLYCANIILKLLQLWNFDYHFVAHCISYSFEFNKRFVKKLQMPFCYNSEQSSWSDDGTKELPNDKISGLTKGAIQIQSQALEQFVTNVKIIKDPTLVRANVLRREKSWLLWCWSIDIVIFILKHRHLKQMNIIV